MAILAVQHIRRMRGGAQSHLMLGEDENAYIVKFQNNPQHPRILVNELLATRLAESLGLTVPFCDVIEVTDWLINNTEALDFDLGPRRERCKAGLCFGSRMVGGLMPGHQLDFLSDDHLAIVKNIHEFAGILAFDKWTCNADGRQAVFTGKPQERRYSATFIDFGYCFNAGEWVFRDSPLRGVYGRTLVYKGITGWESFHPWISLIEAMSATVIWEAAQSIPPEWYLGDASSLEDLVERLIRRQRRVRDLISDFRESRHNPFPCWG